MSSQYLQTLSRLKKQRFGSLQLTGTISSNSFSLLFVTYETLQHSEIIQLFSVWRKKHEDWFQAQFPIDDERTKSWLEKRVLDVPDRLLFIVKIKDTYVGHVGLFRYEETTQTLDIDNIVRGEEGFKGLMQAALQVMMHWAIKELGIKTFTLQTTSDNQKALALYKRLGFTETKRIPLKYRKTNEGGEWIETSDSDDIKRYEVFMIKEG